MAHLGLGNRVRIPVELITFAYARQAPLGKLCIYTFSFLPAMS